MKNYDDVINQLQVYGLRPVFPLETGRLVRCIVDGEREKKGWYAIHEMPVEGGDILLVGTYGIWQGTDDGGQKITLDKSNRLNAEQRKAFAQRMAADKKQAEFLRKKAATEAAHRAVFAWDKLLETGDHEYLERKNIQAYGVRFTEKGALAIPVLDTSGKMHGLQFILDRKKHKKQLEHNRPEKRFWPPGVAKKGHFHLIGSPINILLVAEGYATAASLHAATGLPVVVAFDAGNLAPVVGGLQKRYPRIKIIICADDDAFAKCKECKEPVNVNQSAECPACKKPHGKKNTGVEAASLAAMMYNCHWIKPEFNDPAVIFEHFCKNKGKLTDFNDLHLTDGLHTVRTEIDNAIDGFGLRDSLQHGAKLKQGGGDDENGDNNINPLTHPEELLERFYLVYGEGGVVFDNQEHALIKLTDMRDTCRYRDTHRQWQESMERKIVRMKEVGFDPAGNAPEITCNLWDKWPTTPKKGSCGSLLELLEYLCNDDQEIYNWVLKWLAYPIQHPGAKMRTALVMHGPQGTGKNLFFEAVMAIYGQYGQIIDQPTIEDKFTDWMSCMLFIIADEVVARSDLYHVKNKLKGIITGAWIRINTKNKIAYKERNHVNSVFLSNEGMPNVIEEDDRRHAVIWTPEKLSDEFYKDAAEEISNGGIAALHDYFLNLPLEGFNEHTKPPLNEAKKDLIELGKDNVLRFYDQWRDGELDDVKLQPALSADIYELYRIWAGRQGVRPAPLHRVIDTLARRPGVIKKQERYMTGIKQKKQRFLLPPGVIELNPGQSRTAWLGECVEQFRESIERYKDNGYG